MPALQVQAVTLACPGGELAQALPASAATEPAQPESAEKPGASGRYQPHGEFDHQRAGRAMAVAVSGLAVSTAGGLPLGTLLGQLLGWRGSLGGARFADRNAGAR